MKRILAFGDSFIVGDQDDFGPTDFNHNPKFSPTHGMNYNERLEYLKYNVSFVSLIAKHFNIEFVNYADRGSSNYRQLDRLMNLLHKGELKDPDNLPGVCHIDNTSRVQTVKYEDNKKFRQLLELWYEKSGCPILMNTSLNIKGEPLVNSWEDAKRFQKLNNIKIF